MKEQCDQCGAWREEWQPSDDHRCPNHANPYRSCDGTLIPVPTVDEGGEG